MKLSQISWDDIVSTILTVLLPIIIAWAKTQSAKFKTSNKTLEAVVRGVELAAKEMGRTEGNEVKKVIQNEAIVSGTENHLSKVVEKVTEPKIEPTTETKP